MAITKWEPISLPDLNVLIQRSEGDLGGEIESFWQLIKIQPVKWMEEEYGKVGGGFWVVAICGDKVIWYNDIEEGFNISLYNTFGQIKEYLCEQDELRWTINKLLNNNKV